MVWPSVCISPVAAYLGLGLRTSSRRECFGGPSTQENRVLRKRGKNHQILSDLSSSPGGLPFMGSTQSGGDQMHPEIRTIVGNIGMAGLANVWLQKNSHFLGEPRSFFVAMLRVRFSVWRGAIDSVARVCHFRCLRGSSFPFSAVSAGTCGSPRRF